MLRAAVVAALLWSFGPGGSAAGAAVVFEDEEFNNADWTTTTRFVTSQGATGSSSATRVATSGNPGAFRNVTLTVRPPQVGIAFATAISYQERTAAVYDPGIQGAIASLDFIEDGRNTASSHGTGPALRQGDVIYTGPTLGLTGVPWASYPQLNLDADDFVDIEHFQGAGLHPDFSAAGDPITFGFFRADTERFNRTATSGIDNWSMTVNQLPEPSGLCFLAAGALILMRRRPATTRR